MGTIELLKLRVLAVAVLAVLAVGAQSPDELDRFIETQMARRQIVGLSLAIIHEGRIVDARAYGTTARNGNTPVTPDTLFQAGSVSKPVSAMGALRLVDAGKLSLDEDVNLKLRSWRVPDNEFTKTERVTLRRLLNHSAGITVSGFPGYELTERIPSVPEVLDGRGNTPPVRVDIVPGSDWRYSGGGYVVMQQLVGDVSAKAFADYMSEEVLKPLGMTNSTFQQPLPAPLRSRAAAGHLADRSAIPGGWYAFPEMAPAGLWTTPTDLAKYVIGVQQAFAGKSKVLSADIARQMLTDQRAGMGLGPSVHGNGVSLRFSHNGRTRGFDTILIAEARAGGAGLVAMTNGNDNSLFSQGNCCQNRIVNFVAKKYAWADYETPAPVVVQPADPGPAVLAEVAGRYEFQNPSMIALGTQNGRVYIYADGLPDEEFVPTAAARFVSSERFVSFSLWRNATGEVEGLDWTDPNRKTRRLPRIGPLFSTIAPNADDPDPAFTHRVLTVVQTLAGGKGTAQSPLLTVGARREFNNVAIGSLQGVRAVRFLYESAVAERGIERLGHSIQRVLYYRMDTERGRRWLLVHLDANGLVADFDVVDN